MVASAETLNQGKIIDDDWTIVLPRRNNQKRRFLKLKSAKQQEQTHWAPTDLETTPERELQLMQKMQICIEKLDRSGFFNAFLHQIRTPEVTDHFHKLTGSEEKLKMMIYGIGSIESFDSPRLQLSLAILMKRTLNWIGDMEVFDPIISLTESKVLEELGCRVLSVNEQGKREAVDPILFFMPHCEAELYDNLLKTNWRYDRLNRMVLLGNSFAQYEQHSLVFQKSEMDDSRKHILGARSFVKEFEICTVSDDYFRAFNGSSWHFFSFDPNTNLQLTKELHSHVSHFALKEIYKQYEKIKDDSMTPCTGHFMASMGLSCAHKMKFWQGTTLSLDLIHSQWRIDTLSLNPQDDLRDEGTDRLDELLNELRSTYRMWPLNKKEHALSVINKLVDQSDTIYEPVFQRPKGRPPKSKKKRGVTSTTRDPSRFELVESSQRHNSSNSNFVLQRNNEFNEENNLIDLNIYPSDDYTSLDLYD